MKISTKLKAIVVILSVISLMSAGLVYYMLGGMTDDGRVVNYAGIVRGGAQKAIKMELAGQPADKLIEKLDKIIAGLIDGNRDLGLPKADHSNFIASMGEVRSGWDSLKATVTSHRQSPDQKDKLYQESEKFFELADRAVSNAEENAKGNVFFLKMAQIIALLIIAVVLAFVWVMSQLQISNPLNMITEKTAIVASGDLRVTVDYHGQDEIGQLADGLNKMTASLREIVGNIGKTSSALASSSEELSATTVVLSQGANDQAAQTDQAATAMTEVSQTIVDVARNASDAASASKNAADIAIKGKETVDKTVSGMVKISDTVRESAVMIAELGKSSAEIGNIIRVIEEIAEQTNLLALNAAIEAARAGEQGRGFAVVADEVRKLADRTGKATKEITDMIQKIQMDSKKSVTSMEGGKLQVEEGVRLTDEARASLDKIVDASNKAMDMVQLIATASEEQSTAAEEVSGNMETISDITRKTSESTSQITVASEDLAKLAGDLQRMTSWFKI